MPATLGARHEGLLRRNGADKLVGPAGTIHIFHPNVVHSSSNNRSDDRRALLLITYNRVDNAPAAPSRPRFLVDRDSSPLSARPDPRLSLIPAE